MAEPRPDRLTVLSALQRQGVAPVFAHPDPEVCAAVVAACVRAGAPCVELTDRGDFMAQTFLETARRVAREVPEAMLGVGSVVDAATAALFIGHGARFVVGPVLVPEVARTCNRRMVAYLPGCATASEIGQAHELGCEIVKLFPGEQAGGPEFVRALRGPMPWAKLMPTGGVEPTEASLRAWFDAGAAVVGMGSRLIPAAALEAGDWGEIERRVAAAVALARTARGA